MSTTAPAPGGVEASLDQPWVRWAACGYALIVAAGLAHFVVGLPLQYSDSFGNMLQLSMSWPDLMSAQLGQRAYLRPGLWAELKIVYDAANGHYTPWFRWVHAGQIVALLLLFLALVRPRTRADLVALPLALAVLLGLHTFLGTVRETYPVNTFLSILLFCMAAAALALGRHRWWHDWAVVLLFAAAALTIESGLLVFVVVVAAAVTGARGVSRPGLAALALCTAGYFVLRVALLDTGSPGLSERASGFGFSVLEPSDLVARFGDNPAAFYAYNVVTSIVSLLFSEPSGGVFRLTRTLSIGEHDPARAVYVISSAAATLLLVVYAIEARRRWAEWQLTRDDRLVAIFVAVLGANAVLTYAYSKDVIMSPAGAFYAAAVFVGARTLLGHLSRGALSRLATAGSVVLCAVLGVGWGLRVVGLHLTLRDAAHVERNDWAYIENDVRRGEVSLDPRGEALFRTLQRDALYVYPAPPLLSMPMESWLVPR